MNITKNRIRQIIKESLKNESFKQKLINLVFNNSGQDNESTAQAFALAKSLNIDLVPSILKTFVPAQFEITSTGDVLFYFLLGPKEQGGILGGVLYKVYLENDQNNMIDVLSNLNEIANSLRLASYDDSFKFPAELAQDKRFLSFLSDKLIRLWVDKS